MDERLQKEEWKKEKKLEFMWKPEDGECGKQKGLLTHVLYDGYTIGSAEFSELSKVLRWYIVERFYPKTIDNILTPLVNDIRVHDSYCVLIAETSSELPNE